MPIPNKISGWTKEPEDLRDYGLDHPKAGNLLKMEKALPAKVSWRSKIWGIYNQLELGSCTANAATGVYRSTYKLQQGKDTEDLSRLFVYKYTREMMGADGNGDSGAYIRTAIGSLARGGLPPERYWPYTDDPKKFDLVPPAFVYIEAQQNKILTYLKAETAGQTPATTLKNIKTALSKGQLFEFGFTVYASIYDTKNGDIPFPSKNEEVEGGHAIYAIGYDDTRKIKSRDGKTYTGAIEIVNSWGADWGDQGCGWLPYEYVLQGIAADWWTPLTEQYNDSSAFAGGDDSSNTGHGYAASVTSAMPIVSGTSGAE